MQFAILDASRAHWTETLEAHYLPDPQIFQAHALAKEIAKGLPAQRLVAVSDTCVRRLPLRAL